MPSVFDSNATKKANIKIHEYLELYFCVRVFKAKMTRLPSFRLKGSVVLSSRKVSQKPQKQKNLVQDMTSPFERNKRKHLEKSMKLSVPQVMSFF